PAPSPTPRSWPSLRSSGASPLGSPSAGTGRPRAPTSTMARATRSGSRTGRATGPSSRSRAGTAWRASPSGGWARRTRTAGPCWLTGSPQTPGCRGSPVPYRPCAGPGFTLSGPGPCRGSGFRELLAGQARLDQPAHRDHIHPFGPDRLQNRGEGLQGGLGGGHEDDAARRERGARPLHYRAGAGPLPVDGVDGAHDGPVAQLARRPGEAPVHLPVGGGDEPRLLPHQGEEEFLVPLDHLAQG